jgi:hypothetical protein
MLGDRAVRNRNSFPANLNSGQMAFDKRCVVDRWVCRDMISQRLNDELFHRR